MATLEKLQAYLQAYKAKFDVTNIMTTFEIKDEKQVPEGLKQACEDLITKLNAALEKQQDAKRAPNEKNKEAELEDLLEECEILEDGTKAAAVIHKLDANAREDKRKAFKEAFKASHDTKNFDHLKHFYIVQILTEKLKANIEELQRHLPATQDDVALAEHWLTQVNKYSQTSKISSENLKSLWAQYKSLHTSGPARLEYRVKHLKQDALDTTTILYPKESLKHNECNDKLTEIINDEKLSLLEKHTAVTDTYSQYMTKILPGVPFFIDELLNKITNIGNQVIVQITQRKEALAEFKTYLKSRHETHGIPLAAQLKTANALYDFFHTLDSRAESVCAHQAADEKVIAFDKVSSTANNEIKVSGAETLNNDTKEQMIAFIRAYTSLRKTMSDLQSSSSIEALQNSLNLITTTLHKKLGEIASQKQQKIKVSSDSKSANPSENDAAKISSNSAFSIENLDSAFSAARELVSEKLSSNAEDDKSLDSMEEINFNSKRKQARNTYLTRLKEIEASEKSNESKMNALEKEKAKFLQFDECAQLIVMVAKEYKAGEKKKALNEGLMTLAMGNYENYMDPKKCDEMNGRAMVDQLRVDMEAVKNAKFQNPKHFKGLGSLWERAPDLTLYIEGRKGSTKLFTTLNEKYPKAAVTEDEKHAAKIKEIKNNIAAQQETLKRLQAELHTAEQERSEAAKARKKAKSTSQDTSTASVNGEAKLGETNPTTRPISVSEVGLRAAQCITQKAKTDAPKEAKAKAEPADNARKQSSYARTQSGQQSQRSSNQLSTTQKRSEASSAQAPKGPAPSTTSRVVV